MTDLPKPPAPPECRIVYQSFPFSFNGPKSEFIAWRKLPWWEKMFYVPNQDLHLINR